MPVKYSLSSKPDKSGDFPIRVSIVVKKVRYQTSIGFNVASDAWLPVVNKDTNKKLYRYIKSKYSNAKGMNADDMNAILKKVEAHFFAYEAELKQVPTVEDLKAEFHDAIGKKSEIPTIADYEPKDQTVFSRLEEFKTEQAAVGQWAYATLQCWKTFTNHLTKFNQRIKFEDFDETGLNKFVRFLRITQNLEEKTVQKHFSNLKWFLNWAIRKGYTKQDFINRYKVKFKVLQKPVIFLTKEELMKLYNYQIPANQTKVTLHHYNGDEYEFKVEEAGALAKTRDLFCFCAFTSLRYSDMAKVKRSDIVGDILYVTTQKTNDRLPIDLNSFAKEILNKYKGEKFPGNLALPVISNQKMNKYLKNLCELCEINEPITETYYKATQRVEETKPKYEYIGTHAGRRTFICFALSSGIPPQVVMKWTGHSDYKAMKPYIDIAEKTKADAMKLFEDSLGM